MARKLTPEEEQTLSDVLGSGPGIERNFATLIEELGRLREKTPLRLSSELEVWYGDEPGNARRLSPK